MRKRLYKPHRGAWRSEGTHDHSNRCCLPYADMGDMSRPIEQQIPRRAFARRGIVRENIGERTALSGCHQVMDA